MIVWRRVRALVVCLVVAGCGEEQRIDDVFTRAEWEYLQTFGIDRLAPIDAGDEARARLGQQLFFDPRYSGPIRVASDAGAVGETGKISCDRCHDPQHYFSDPSPRSLGADLTKRNVPGLVDLAYRRAFIWDGKFASLEDVLELALESEAAMNATFDGLRDHVLSTYAETYGALFPGMTTLDEVKANVKRALAAYERRLQSGPAPFDRYLAGDPAAIDDAAKRGAQLFIGKALCSECHDGPLFADDEFHVTGVEQGGDQAPDRGRYKVTNDLADDGKFRTPTLRHIARTAPYMHAGQHATLPEVLEFYRWGGDATGFAGTKDPRMLPLELTDDDLRDLEAFLHTLTGVAVDPTWTTRPVLP
jgi:cytochrome c peroxidase